MKGTNKWLDNLKSEVLTVWLVVIKSLNDSHTSNSLKEWWYRFGDNGFDRDAAGGVQEGALANPSLTWEKSRKMNIGLDAAFLNERLTLSIDYFNEHRYDIITSLSGGDKLGFPDIVGKDAPFINSGIVR
jgi:TonB dependent receptor.